MLREISRQCRTCKMNAAKPKRFEISCTLEEDIRYNAEVEVDKR